MAWLLEDKFPVVVQMELAVYKDMVVAHRAMVDCKDIVHKDRVDHMEMVAHIDRAVRKGMVARKDIDYNTVVYIPVYLYGLGFF